MNVPCPNCHQVLQLPDGSAGQAFRCPKCKHVFTVAPPRQPAAPPPPLSRPPSLVTAPPPPPPSRTPPSRNPAPTPASPGKLPVALVLAGVVGVLLLAAGSVWLTLAKSTSRQARNDQGAEKNDKDRGTSEGEDDSRDGNRSDKSGSGKKDKDSDGSAEGGPGSLPALKPLPALPPAADGSVGPIFLGQIHSLDGAIRRARLGAESVGRSTDLEEILAELKKKVSKEGAEGFDDKRPLGGYAVLGDEPKVWTVVMMLPVKDELKFHRLLGDLGYKEKDPISGVIPIERSDGPLVLEKARVQGDLPKQLFMRLANGYAYFCLGGDIRLLQGDKPMLPKNIFTESGQLLSVTCRLDRLPEKTRIDLLAQLDEAQRKADDFEGPAKEFTRQGVKHLCAYSKDLITGGRNVTFDVGVGPEKKTVSVDLYLQGQKGSALEKHLEDLGKSSSQFAALALEESAFSALVNLRLPVAIRKLLPGVVEEATKAALAGEKDPEKRKEGERLFATIGPTFGGGEIDAALALISTNGKKPATVVGGMKVVEGEKADKAIQEQVRAYPNKEFSSLFQMNVDKIAGANVHRFVGQKDLPEELRQVFGDNPFYYALRDDALCYSAGARGKQELARALQVKPRRSPLFLISGNARQLNELFAVQESDIELARTMFKEQPGRFRLELTGGESLRLHFGTDLALLGFAVKRVMEAPAK